MILRTVRIFDEITWLKLARRRAQLFQAKSMSAHASAAARSGGARRVRRRAPPQRTTSNTRAWNVQNRIEIESALRLLLLAAEPGVRIERVCLLDHSSPGYRPRHLHVQCIFTDGSFSVWLTVDGTVPTLREALRAVQPGRVRIHVHEELEEEEEEEAPNGGAASARTIAALPCLTLEKRSADHLAADGIDACPFCLEGFVTGDEVLCMPCPGKHIAHAPCMHQWLQIASTCPSCRFMLPHGLPSAELHTLIDPARSELAKLRLSPRTSGTCGECETDDEDITTSMPAAGGAAGVAAGGAPGSSAGGLPMDTAREGDKFDAHNDAQKLNVAALHRPEFEYRTAAEAVASASASAMAAAAAASAAAAARAEPYRDRFIAAAAAAAASLDEAQSAEAREMAELLELLRSGSQSPRHLSTISTSALISGGVSAAAFAASNRSTSSSSSSSIALPTPPPLMPPPLLLPYSLSPTTVVQFSRIGPAVVTQYNSPSTAPRLSTYDSPSTAPRLSTAPTAARPAARSSIEPSRLRLPRMSWGRREAPN